jgi:hypothetical protein
VPRDFRCPARDPATGTRAHQRPVRIWLKVMPVIVAVSAVNPIEASRGPPSSTPGGRPVEVPRRTHEYADNCAQDGGRSSQNIRVVRRMLNCHSSCPVSECLRSNPTGGTGGPGSVGRSHSRPKAVSLGKPSPPEFSQSTPTIA